MTDTTISLAITSLITIAGWVILHIFSKHRDNRNKEKELRLSYLIDAWRKLEYAANRPNIDKVEYIERPIADIQLFGTIYQIELAQHFTDEIVLKNNANLNSLLEELRKDLRKELKYDEAPLKIRYLRFK